MISASTKKMNPVHHLRGSSQEKYKVLAKLNGWSLGYAQGYVEGELARMNNTTPANYAVVGIDEYCLGYRAGYFANARRSPNVNASGKKHSVGRMR